MAKTVLVVGGSYAGLAVTHRLLKHTLPKEKDLKVILVSKSTHLYWNLASVRAVVPGVLKDEQIFQPIEPGLKQYPSENVEFVVGTVTALDQAAKTATVSTSDADADSSSRAISYDFLVLATGAASVDASVPWKVSGTHDEARELVHATADKVKAASHIVVAGSGATGIELAGELAYEFGDKKTVVLLCADNAVAGGDSSAGSIEKELTKLGVQVKKGAKVESASPATGDGAEGKTDVKLSNGDTIVTDLYLPTMGLVPNTDFLPAALLTDAKYVAVDDQLRVKGAENAWALGDVISRPRATFVNVEPQAAGVAKNVEAALNGKPQQVVKNLPVDVFVCSVGRGRAAGRIGPVPIFSIMGYLAKGKTLGMQMMPKFVDGSQF